LLSPALYLYIYFSCLVNGNLCDSVCNIKNGPFHSIMTSLFYVFFKCAMKSCFQQGEHYIVRLFLHFHSSISVHILSFKVPPLEGSRWTNNSGHRSSSGTPFPRFQKRYPIMLWSVDICHVKFKCVVLGISLMHFYVFLLLSCQIVIDFCAVLVEMGISNPMNY